MAVLITGGSGFIGQFLIREFARRGTDNIRVVDSSIDSHLSKEIPDVEFINADISSLRLSQWKDLLKDVDVVYHLAGLLGTTELFAKIIEAERVNVLGTISLLEAIRICGFPKIIFTSKPNVWKHNVYTITKEHCERYLIMYQEVYAIKHVILRPFNVYGPKEKTENYRKAVPYFIISSLKNEPIEIFGSGEQTMDLVYVTDCANAIIIAGNTPDAVGKTIEIGTGIETSVKDLAKLIIRLTGSNSQIKYLPMRKGEIENSKLCADTKNMREILNHTPKVGLEEGIKETIDYYRSNLEKYKVYRYSEGLELNEGNLKK